MPEVQKIKKPRDRSRDITENDVVVPATIVQAEHRSSVEIKQTAKGDPMIEVKIYVGTSLEEAEAAASVAFKIYKKTRGRIDKDGNDA